MITNQGKNLMLKPHQTMLRCEIGKSTNTTLSYSFNPRYDVRDLNWNNPINNEIKAAAMSFNIPAGGEPNLIVSTNLSNYSYGTVASGTYNAATQYFNTYVDMMSAIPTSASQTARVGKKFATSVYNFILIESNNAYPSNLLLQTYNWPEYSPFTTTEEDFYQRIDSVFGTTIYDDYAIVIRIDGSGGSDYFIPLKMGNKTETTAYPTTSFNTLKAVYPIVDHFQTQMEFLRDSVIRISEIKVDIRG